MQCPECGSAKLTVTTVAYLAGPDRNRTTCNECPWEGQAHHAERAARDARDRAADRAAATEHVEGLLERHERRGQRIQAALVEFLSAVARDGGHVEAIEVDEMTLRVLAGRVMGGIVVPVQFYGPAGPVVLRKGSQ